MSSTASSGSFQFTPPLGYGHYEFNAKSIDSLNNQNDLDDNALCSADYGSSAPCISLSADSHDFGEVKTGGVGEWALQITNTGEESLTVSGLETSGEFACSPETPIEIEGGGQYRLSIMFSPTTYGQHNGWAKITSNDASQPSCQIDLAGVGYEEGATPQTTFTLNKQSYIAGDRLFAQVEAEYYGRSRTADLHICVLMPDGTPVYLPTFSTSQSPFIASIHLRPGYTLGRMTILDLHLPELPPGDYTFAAFFCDGADTLGEAAIASFTINGGEPSVELLLNKTAFTSGDLMTLSRTIMNPGAARTVNFYLAVWLPTGELLFYPSLSDVASPFAPNLLLGQTHTIGPDVIVQLTMPALVPGGYFWLAGFTPTDRFEVIGDVACAEWTYY